MTPAFFTISAVSGEWFLCEAGRCKVSGTLEKDRREAITRMCEQLGEPTNERFILRHDQVKDERLFERLIRSVVTVTDNELDCEFIARAVGREQHDASMRAVLLDESPKQVYQPGLGLVTESIALDGVSIHNQRSVPLIDADDIDSATVQTVVGSVRDIRKDQGALIGTVRFASDKASRDAFEKYASGHLTEFAAVLRRLEREVQSDGTHKITKSEILAVRVGAI